MFGVPYKDRDRRRAYGRDWMRRNLDKARLAMRRWRAEHPEEHRERRRDWEARSREIRRTIWQRRRARILGAEGSYTVTEWLELVASCGGRCGYCGAPGALAVDHRLPIARGGTNRIENLIPACKTCNSRKHLMTEEEFRARLARERGDAA